MRGNPRTKGAYENFFGPSVGEFLKGGIITKRFRVCLNWSLQEQPYQKNLQNLYEYCGKFFYSFIP